MLDTASTKELLDYAKNFIGTVNQIQYNNIAAEKSRQSLIESIKEIEAMNESNREAIKIANAAIEVLRQVNSVAVEQAYRFLETNLNEALSRMFKGTTRQIRIKETMFRQKYLQLNIELDVGGGITRSIKDDSGHGIAQIISFLSLLCLIVITGQRKLMVIDEVLSGVSIENRRIINDIMWAFTEIGFQFLVNEHGFIPQGAYVYHLEMVGGVSGVKDEYTADSGLYLEGKRKADDNKYKNSYDLAEETADDRVANAIVMSASMLQGAAVNVEQSNEEIILSI